uniref:Uncharacterized protein n=1 Tax=Panagrolaimus sp. PS1159 TaxID=55785 RepID=A0AC35G091_9BILA
MKPFKIIIRREGLQAKIRGIGMMTFVFKRRHIGYYGFGFCIFYCKCEVCMMKERKIFTLLHNFFDVCHYLHMLNVEAFVIVQLVYILEEIQVVVHLRHHDVD